MRLALTGTPGTGKTTVADLVETALEVIHLNEEIRERGLYDAVDTERDSVVADLDAVAEWLGDRDDILIESHLAHELPVDAAVVLRCRPAVLESRLRERGEPVENARENAESEALDLILAETVDALGRDHVFEIDTTGRSPEAVAGAIEAVIHGDREPSAGTVSFIDYLAEDA